MLFKAMQSWRILTACMHFADMQGGQSIQVRQQHEVYNLDLPTLNMKKNYDFRIRMKLWCLDKDWNNWTKVQSWGNNEGTISLSLKYHVFRFRTRAWFDK